MTNTNELRMQIEASGLKLNAICKACGVSYTTLRSKINNESEFTAKEISIISCMLNLSAEARDAIFFYEQS